MIEQRLQTIPLLCIRQKKELVELLGVETRNQYSIETEQGEKIAYAAEEPKGILGMIFRQALGHWRTFTIHLLGPTREEEFSFHHPFRFYFERLEVTGRNGEKIGAVQRRFSILTKRFDVEDSNGQVVMTVASPFWRIWTFRFLMAGRELAVISKRWSGFGKELFLDADNFVLQYSDPTLNPKLKVLLLGAAIFIDIRYFEKKGGGGVFSLSDLLPSSE